MVAMLFSTQGRINRSRFWLYSILSSIAAGIVFGLLMVVLWSLFPGTIDANGQFNVNGANAVPYIIAVIAYFVYAIWTTICIGVKRFHDLDKPGVWMLILFVPFLGGIIYFVMAGCLRGTIGPNQYGPDPLQFSA